MQKMSEWQRLQTHYLQDKVLINHLVTLLEIVLYVLFFTISQTG